MEVNSPKRYLLVEGKWGYGVDLGIIGRVGQAVSLHKWNMKIPKNGRPLAKLLMDELGKESTLQRMHPGVCECGPGIAGQCLLSALGYMLSLLEAL